MHAPTTTPTPDEPQRRAVGGCFYLRLPDGRRTRLYIALDAAERAAARGETFTDDEYERGAFWPTPGNPRPGAFSAPGKRTRRAA